MVSNRKKLSAEDEMGILELEKKSARNYKNRRIIPWNETYQLYRDNVISNRFTQRQSINVPLMKYGIATNLKDIDDVPVLTFRNLDNDQQAEIYYNELWKETARREKLVVKDLVDKKQILLFGRSFKKLNIEDGKVTFEIISPEDILVQRYVDPSNLESARCVIQTGIYRTLTNILDNDDYLDSGKSKLRSYVSESPTVAQEETQSDMVRKGQRLQDLGVDDTLSPVVGETYIELNEIYRFEYSEELKEEVIFLYTVADISGTLIKLQKKEFCKIFGETRDDFWYYHFPFSACAGDPERTDFWSDGAGDVLRQINKVLNTWTGQLVENRTLRNFNMNYYDSSESSFVPQTFTPEPWGWYPLPGKPQDVLQSVQVADLSESLDEMQFLIAIGEKAIAATATQTGDTMNNVTLGEVQLALSNAQERVKGLDPLIQDSWEDFGIKYIKLLEGRSDLLNDMTISRRGRLGKKMYTKTIKESDWKTPMGYVVEVRTKANKGAEDTDMLQKLNYAKTLMPENIPLTEIVEKKSVEFAGLNSDDQSRVIEFQKQLRDQMLSNPLQQLGPGAPVQGTQPMGAGMQPQMPMQGAMQ
jgi:hypothetical protein